MELEDLDPKQAEESKALADEEASELCDDSLDSVSGGRAYTSMDGYTIDDGMSPEFEDTLRMYLDS